MVAALTYSFISASRLLLFPRSYLCSTHAPSLSPWAVPHPLWPPSAWSREVCAAGSLRCSAAPTHILVHAGGVLHDSMVSSQLTARHVCDLRQTSLLVADHLVGATGGPPLWELLQCTAVGGDAPTARSNHAAAAWGPYLLVLGGWAAGAVPTPLLALEVLHLGSNEWCVLSPIPRCPCSGVGGGGNWAGAVGEVF